MKISPDDLKVIGPGIKLRQPSVSLSSVPRAAQRRSIQMKKFAILPMLGLGFATASSAAISMLHEEEMARDEETRIITHPIAGIENRFWFDYRIDVTEAQKELSSDLRRASDVEDLREAWEEYAHQLRGEREHYVEEMAERGYRLGRVIVVD